LPYQATQGANDREERFGGIEKGGKFYERSTVRYFERKGDQGKEEFVF
jgi:hypothetical protein